MVNRIRLKEVSSLTHDGEVTAICFDPSGKNVVTLSGYATLTCWDVETGDEIFNTDDEDSFIMAARPVTPMITTIGDSPIISLSSFADGAHIQNLVPPKWEQEESLTALAFTPDGNFLAVADLRGRIYLWDIEKQQRTLIGNMQSAENEKQGDCLSSLAFDPHNPSRLFCGYEKNSDGYGHYVGSLFLWDTSKGTYESLASYDNRGISRISITPNGSLLAVVTGGNIEMWDAQTKARLHTIPSAINPENTEPSPNNACAIAFSPDSSLLIGGTTDKRVLIWDAQTGENVGEVGTAWRVEDIAISHDGALVAAACYDIVQVWAVQ